MIEFTTGVVFLMSSLYGSGQANGQMQAMQIVDNRIQTGSAVTEVRTVVANSNNSNSVEAYLRKAYVGEPLLIEIARCESNFHQFDKNGEVIRGIVNSADVGVMQINEKYHGEMAKKLGFDLYSTEGNIAYARHLFEEQGAQPWSSSAKCWSASKELAKK